MSLGGFPFFFSSFNKKVGFCDVKIQLTSSIRSLSLVHWHDFPVEFDKETYTWLGLMGTKRQKERNEEERAFGAAQSI